MCCSILSVGGFEVRKARGVLISPEISSCSRLICISDCSPVTIRSFSCIRHLISIISADFRVHVIRHVFSSHYLRFTNRNRIRMYDTEVGMTVVRYQIHCLASKNDAVVIVIINDRDSSTFQCRSAQERITVDAHHVKCDLDQNSSAAVRHHMSVNHFLSTVLQRHFVCCHCFNVRSADHIRNRSSTRARQAVRNSQATLRANSLSVDVWRCLPTRKSTVLHRRVPLT